MTDQTETKDQETEDQSQKQLKAALIIIGNEVLSGRTQDTHTSWLAERLTGYGIVLCEVRIIPDTQGIIVDTVNDMRPHFDLIFTTGGIGPTHDDITAESIAAAFGVELERNEDAYHMLEEHYGRENLTPPRLKMAQIPRTAKLIPNPVTAAPGFVMENVHVMAGVPRIMQAMVDHVLGTVEAGVPILSNTVACGLQESVLADDLGALQKKFPDIDVGSYPHYRGGILGLSLVLRGTNDKALHQATDELVQIITDHGDEPRALSIRTTGKE